MQHLHCISFVVIFDEPIQDGISPLAVASQFGHTEVVDALLNYGADPNQATMVQKTLFALMLYSDFTLFLHSFM